MEGTDSYIGLWESFLERCNRVPQQRNFQACRTHNKDDWSQGYCYCVQQRIDKPKLVLHVSNLQETTIRQQQIGESTTRRSSIAARSSMPSSLSSSSVASYLALFGRG
jgi:hypothetical protein